MERQVAKDKANNHSLMIIVTVSYSNDFGS